MVQLGTYILYSWVKVRMDCSVGIISVLQGCPVWGILFKFKKTAHNNLLSLLLFKLTLRLLILGSKELIFTVDTILLI